MLKTFGMGKSRPVGTPMATRCKLSKEGNTPKVKKTQYKLMIGKFQYLVHNRPNISHVIGIVEIFSTTPKQTHMIVVKMIYIYLK